MSTDTSIESIREAAVIVGEALAAFDPSDYPLHVFSEKHESAMRRILSFIAGRKRKRPLAKRLIACLIALLILFAGAYIFLPSVHAAVNEWFFTVWNNTMEFFFPHSGNDHAFPVMTPASIPDRFMLSSDKSGDGYRTLEYTDSTNGDYITFDYRWINEKRAEKLKQDIEKNGSVTLHHGYNALLTEGRNKTTLKWYEPQNMLGFSAESNIPADELIQAFSEMDIRLPEYEPTWIPDGFELVYENHGPTYTSLTYVNDETDGMIGFDYYDYGNEDSFTGLLTDADIIEETNINGYKATLAYTDKTSEVYDINNIYNGLALVWIDDEINIIFIVSGSISAENAIRFSESINTK